MNFDLLDELTQERWGHINRLLGYRLQVFLLLKFPIVGVWGMSSKVQLNVPCFVCILHSDALKI